MQVDLQQLSMTANEIVLLSFVLKRLNAAGLREHPLAGEQARRLLPHICIDTLCRIFSTAESDHSIANALSFEGVAFCRAAHVPFPRHAVQLKADSM